MHSSPTITEVPPSLDTVAQVDPGQPVYDQQFNNIVDSNPSLADLREQESPQDSRLQNAARMLMLLTFIRSGNTELADQLTTTWAQSTATIAEDQARRNEHARFMQQREIVTRRLIDESESEVSEKQ